jgi:uncharacterized protein YbjT (DUF2867 family)
MPLDPGPLLVTGANGHLGRHLISQLAGSGRESGGLRAVVRSQGAAEQVRSSSGGGNVEIHVVDYADASAVEAVAAGCRAVAHFVGIIKESRRASYRDAHEESCAALARAAEAAAVERNVNLSILGADPASRNRCLASRGHAEEILLSCGVSTAVIRVPMVIGPGDPASRSLRAQARARLLPLVGGGRTRHQPIDSRDVLAAVWAASERPELGDQILELGGPEGLSHRDLVDRAARLYGTRPFVLPLPVTAVRAAVALLERLSADPPLTTTMLEILQHDDCVDATQACEQLGIELTPLGDTLETWVGPEAEEP